MAKEILVAYGCDVDAVAGQIGSYAGGDSPCDISRGVHAVWFDDGEFVHMASGAPDFEPTNPKDDQIYRIVDVRNPSKPTEVGRWWLPGMWQAGGEPPRAPKGKRCAAHHAIVAGNLAYGAWRDGGLTVHDVSDPANVKLVIDSVVP